MRCTASTPRWRARRSARSSTRGPAWSSRSQDVLDAITPADARGPDRQSEQSHRHGNRAARHRAHSAPRAQGRGADRRGLLRILRRHRAAARSSACPNLFVSRTFSKVFGMAAMRLGCLFSHEANVALPAQGAIAVQREHAGGAGGAGGGARTASTSRTYVAEVLAARELLCVGLEKLGIRYVPSSANFVLGRRRRPRDRSARRAARPGHPGARPQLRSAGLRAHHGRHARADAAAAGRAGGDLEPMSQPILVFDMDGVLVDVTESYRETIAQHRGAFHRRRKPAQAQIQDYKNQGGWNNDWELSHQIVASAGVEVAVRGSEGILSVDLPRQRQRRPDPARALGGAARPARDAPSRVPARDLHRAAAGGEPT